MATGPYDIKFTRETKLQIVQDAIELKLTDAVWISREVQRTEVGPSQVKETWTIVASSDALTAEEKEYILHVYRNTAKWTMVTWLEPASNGTESIVFSRHMSKEVVGGCM